MKARLAAALAMLHVATATAADGVCTRWSEPAKVGDLDIRTLMEASGIALPANSPRLYHVNDGDGALFHVTDLAGRALQSVSLTGFKPLDIEDLASGPCGRAVCLYIADIGDNAVRRESVQIALVQIADRFGETEAPIRNIIGRYPDGPHDAEALALHPSGDLYIATKSRIGRQQDPSLLFRLGAAQLAAGGEQMFELVGSLAVDRLSAQLGDSPRRIVTAMDISPDGSRFLLLTYDAAIEFAADLGKGLPAQWPEGTHHAFAIAPLLQAEAIAYGGDGRSILYSTESIRGTPAPLMQQVCQDPGAAPR
jgi:hypothetical protein